MSLITGSKNGSNVISGVNGSAIIVPSRNGKPSLYAPFPFRNEKGNAAPENCVFCPGNERETTEELQRIEKGGQWQARRILSKHPISPSLHGREPARHEVIIATSEHSATFSTMSLEENANHLLLLASSKTDIEKLQHVSYVAQFTNEGFWAGASMPHPHSQSIAFPHVPKNVKQVSQACTQPKSCVFCKAVRGEKLLVAQNEHFLAVCPEDSQYYYQITIIGKKHIPSLNALPDSMLASLAEIFKLATTALDAVTNFASYNVLYCSAPPKSRAFHFHVDIFPRISQQGGFELIGGIALLHTSPQNQAGELRAAIKSLQ